MHLAIRYMFTKNIPHRFLTIEFRHWVILHNFSAALGDTKPPAEAREPDLKQLDLLQEIFSNPNVDDNKIIAAMKNFDKAPIDRSIKDLSNVLKLLVTEQQLSHQSLRIISIAMDKVRLEIEDMKSTLENSESYELSADAREVSKLLILLLAAFSTNCQRRTAIKASENPTGHTTGACWKENRH